MEFVAELGPCEGSVDYARRAIEQLAGTGIAMKVQWYTADELVVPGTERYDNTDDRAIDQYEMFQTQLSIEHWKMIAREAQEAGVPFFPTVFDEGMVGHALEAGLSRVKIASADVTHLPLIRAAAKVGDLVISTGAATQDEVGAAVEAAKKANPHVGLTLLACHLEYPSERRNAHLGRIASLRHAFGEVANVGYSDHTPGIETIGYLALMGVTMWEKHVTLGDVPNFGDHTFAVTVDEMRMARDVVSGVAQMVGNPALAPSSGEMAARQYARRGTYAARAIRKGEKVERGDVRFLRPHKGMTPAEFEKYGDGRMAMVDLKAGEPITSKNVGGVGASLTVE